MNRKNRQNSWNRRILRKVKHYHLVTESFNHSIYSDRMSTGDWKNLISPSNVHGWRTRKLKSKRTLRTQPESRYWLLSRQFDLHLLKKPRFPGMSKTAFPGTFHFGTWGHKENPRVISGQTGGGLFTARRLDRSEENRCSKMLLYLAPEGY